ncbi:hypothetical protein ANN_14909 [Periplaneta americana]|uniref:Uncharacterized protein n=1 Tax=Periplaneta americana TaxID=6978 RepID=A0ABQ8SXL1_PERAM|nr:hypothetical protein ANN_14909 [Periplaneta americana]
MAGLCEGGNEPPGSLKAILRNQLHSDENAFRSEADTRVLRDVLFFPLDRAVTWLSHVIHKLSCRSLRKIGIQFRYTRVSQVYGRFRCLERNLGIALTMCYSIFLLTRRSKIKYAVFDGYIDT